MPVGLPDQQIFCYIHPVELFEGDYMSFGTNLRSIRKLKNLTQGDLSSLSKVKTGHISKLERDDIIAVAFWW